MYECTWCASILFLCWSVNYLNTLDATDIPAFKYCNNPVQIKKMVSLKRTTFYLKQKPWLFQPWIRCGPRRITLAICLIELCCLLQLQHFIELIRLRQCETALEYAQLHLAAALQADADKLMIDRLERAMALLAFDEPTESPFSDLLLESQRHKVSHHLFLYFSHQLAQNL